MKSKYHIFPRYLFMLLFIFISSLQAMAQDSTQKPEGATPDMKTSLTSANWSYSRFNRYGHRLLDINVYELSANRKFLSELHYFPIVFTIDDSFGNEGSISASLITAPILIAYAGRNQIHNEIITSAMLLPALLNGRHHLVLGAKTRQVYGDAMISYGLSLFVKNETDLFIGRHPWLSVSPGAGINTWISGLQFQVGYSYNIGWDFKRSRIEPWYYFTLGIPFPVGR